MAYSSPGVKVTNVFEPIVSPTAGGDRVLAILGLVNVSNINLYPVKNVETRKDVATTDPSDSIVFTIPDPSLGTIADASRIVKVWQGSKTYTVVSGDTYVYSETKGATGVADSITTTLTGSITGTSVVAVYYDSGTAITRYSEGTDFSYTVTQPGGAGTANIIAITWDTAYDNPTEGVSYTVVVGDSSAGSYYPIIDKYTAGQVTITMLWNPESASLPTDGSSYLTQVRMEYPYDRMTVTSLDEAVSNFGAIVDATDPDYTDATKRNVLSMAAYLAFTEGAPSIVLVPYDASVLSASDALDLLAQDTTVNIVTAIDTSAIVTGGTDVNNLVLNHVLDCSTELYKKYRIGLFNPTVGVFSAAFSQTATTGYRSMVDVCDSQRAVIIGPSQMTFKMPVSTGTYVDFKSDGGYGGVVYGAMMCRPEYDVATAMLRKSSRTIYKIRKDHSWDDKKCDMIASMGVTLFALINSVYAVRDDITTSQDATIMMMEPAITMISDNIAQTAIRVLDAALIGTKLLLPQTLEAVKTRLMSMLEAKSRPPAIIIGYGVPELTVDSVDTRKINVIIPIQPVMKVREINITFSYVSSL